MKLSVLNSKNDRFRIDAEFSKKVYINTEKFLESKKHTTLKESICKIYHPKEIKREYVIENGIWFFRAQNLRPLLIENSNNVFISKNDAEDLKDNSILYGDILITRTGANFGQTAMYHLKEKAISSSHVLIVRTNYFNPYYLTVFLNTNYGRIMLNKGMYGGSQPEIAPYYISNIPIPILSKNFERILEKLYKKANEFINDSNLYYSKIELILLKELGMANWQPTVENKSIKKFSKSYESTERLDAEYYQPKYDELMKMIKKNKYATLDELVEIRKSIEPGSEAYQSEGIPFLRVANISKYEISDTDIYLNEKEFNDENLNPRKDTILFSKDGSIGIAYKLEKNIEAITSSALLHLKVKNNNILPDYLTLVLNSKLVQLQAERDSGGSIIQHWRIDEIKNVLIPILEMGKQIEISNEIKRSFSLRKQSKELLERAKRAVEIAIEKNEQRAIEIIPSNF